MTSRGGSENVFLKTRLNSNRPPYEISEEEAVARGRGSSSSSLRQRRRQRQRQRRQRRWPTTTITSALSAAKSAKNADTDVVPDQQQQQQHATAVVGNKTQRTRRSAQQTAAAHKRRQQQQQSLIVPILASKKSMYSSTDETRSRVQALFQELDDIDQDSALDLDEAKNVYRVIQQAFGGYFLFPDNNTMDDDDDITLIIDDNDDRQEQERNRLRTQVKALLHEMDNNDNAASSPVQQQHNVHWRDDVVEEASLASRTGVEMVPAHYAYALLWAVETSFDSMLGIPIDDVTASPCVVPADEDEEGEDVLAYIEDAMMKKNSSGSGTFVYDSDRDDDGNEDDGGDGNEDDSGSWDDDDSSSSSSDDSTTESSLPTIPGEVVFSNNPRRTRWRQRRGGGVWGQVRQPRRIVKVCTDVDGDDNAVIETQLSKCGVRWRPVARGPPRRHNVKIATAVAADGGDDDTAVVETQLGSCVVVPVSDKTRYHLPHLPPPPGPKIKDLVSRFSRRARHGLVIRRRSYDDEKLQNQWPTVASRDDELRAPPEE